MKTKIYINGKEINPSEVTFEQVLENIFGKTYDDIPEEYSSPEDYLMLSGLNLSINSCGSKEKVSDLSKKLKDRLVWISKHKDYKYDEIRKFLQNNLEELADSVIELSNTLDAYKLVIGYVNNVMDITKKK